MCFFSVGSAFNGFAAELRCYIPSRKMLYLLLSTAVDLINRPELYLMCLEDHRRVLNHLGADVVPTCLRSRR